MNKDLSDAKLTPTNTHIFNSYLVKTKDEMREYLQRLREVATENAVNKRDMESMVREWRSHNLFYFFHVFRSRTRDVDLELNQSWPREMFCRVVDFFYFW